MSYLQDRKIKRNKNIRYSIFIIFIVSLIYFRAGVFKGFSYISSIVFRPVLSVGRGIGEGVDSFSSYFYSKKILLEENEILKAELLEKNNKLSNYNSIVNENLDLKETLGRKGEKDNKILASILSKPNQSLYDTLIIDIGSNHNVLVGQKVYALGNVPIGRISEVYPKSSKVILYSSPGEKTEVIVSGKPIVQDQVTSSDTIPAEDSAKIVNKINGEMFMQVIGRGGGNFEMLLPRDLVLQKGTEVTLPGINSSTLGIIESILSDPRDSFQKALLSSPVNIQEIKFVEVEKQS